MKFCVSVLCVLCLVLAMPLSAKDEHLTPLFQEDEEGNYLYEGQRLGQIEQSLVRLHRFTILLSAFGRPAEEAQQSDQPQNLQHAAAFLERSCEQEKKRFWVVALREPASRDEVTKTIGAHLIERTRRLVGPEADQEGTSFTATVVKQMEPDDNAIKNCVVCVTMN